MSDFQKITDWLLALDNVSQIPEKFLKKAKQYRDALLSTSDKPVLLHGDLHQDNILKNGGS